MPSVPKVWTTSFGSRKLPRLLDIFSPWTVMNPWTHTLRGASSPALHSIAGQKIVWKRAMSLPMMWRSAGHHRPNSPRVVGEPGAGDVVDQRVVPDVDLARLRVPRAVLALRRLAVLGDRERMPQSPGVRSRLIEKSSSPWRMNPSISLRR